MTRDYSSRKQSNDEWVNAVLGRLERCRDGYARFPYDDLLNIVNLNYDPGVELVSFYVYGQPTPETFTATFLADRSEVNELVAKLLLYHDQIKNLCVETWPDPESQVSVKGPLAPWTGVGQPTPAAISTET